MYFNQIACRLLVKFFWRFNIFLRQKPLKHWLTPKRGSTPGENIIFLNFAWKNLYFELYFILFSHFVIASNDLSIRVAPKCWQTPFFKSFSLLCASSCFYLVWGKKMLKNKFRPVLHAICWLKNTTIKPAGETNEYI